MAERRAPGAPAVKVPVRVDGRDLVLTNLGKVLYPAVGFSKAEVLDYYTRVAAVLLPHVARRPLTVKRYPDGVEGHMFYEKNIPAHAPDWVARVTLPAPGSTKQRATLTYVLPDDLATLTWAANLASLELHVPMWRVDDDGQPRPPDLLVLDLDPGPPADVVACARVALRLRELLAADGLTGYPKTSGSKGLQVYVPLAGDQPWETVHGYARALARALAAALPDDVVWVMRKDLRGGKVLLDWSQNNPAKTTVAPYSLRALAEPTVSTPLTWAEVAACRRPGDLRFTAGAVLDRVQRDGDLFAGCRQPGAAIPG